MLLISYLLLLLFYLVTGYGVLTLFRLQLKPAYMITLSLLCGVAVASVVPFVLQLLYIPLTSASVFGGLALAALGLNTPTILRIRREGFAAVRRSFAVPPFRVFPYEIPFLAIFIFFALVSIWRCYYLPPTSRDALSGPEAIAEFAVREHTMINSFFGIDLSTTNNQFKSPFLISLQMICKMAGFPFGQVWLSVVFVSFNVFLYHALRERLHPIIAGLLLLLFFMTPEVYAYTFMILYDYSNMVFFFLSLWFLFGYFRNKNRAWFYFSGLLMGIATYIRSETLVLAFLFLPPILLVQRRERMAPGKIVLANLYYLLPSVLGYLLPGPLYIGHYLPAHYDVGSLVNKNPADLSPLFQRYSDIVTHLIASPFGVQLWGYIYFFAALVLVAEIFVPGRFNREARNWLYAVLVLFLGVGALGFILPLIDLNDTTKRELFKMLPPMLLYLANSAALIRISQWISRWEGKPVVIGKPLVAAAVGGAPPKSGAKPGPGSSKKRRKR
ncbi:MAG TPA: glycosyltransferase family 39 protein [Puia sp.]|nr:glycosyltransferase family 39 protein [Puia sp.]